MSPEVYRVLLIEDNEGDAFLLKEMLEEGVGGNFHLECRETLMEGFTQIATGGFDVVFLDLGLPESTGIATFFKVKATYPGMPVIVLTSLDDEAVALAVVHAGAQDYLLKGQTDGRTLRRAIRYAIERTEADRALRASEARYRQLFEDNPLPAFIWDTETMKVLDVNRAATQQYGYSREEFLGLSIMDLRPPEHVGKLIIGLALSDEEVQQVSSFRHRRKDGTTFEAIVSSHSLVLNNRPCRLILVMDITERRRTEEALRVTQFTVDNAVNAVYWIRPDGHLLYVNEAACQGLGYSREELLGMRIQDYDVQLTDDEWLQQWDILKDQKRVVVTTTHKTKDGRSFPVELTADYVHYGENDFVCAFARDISEQIRAEEEKSRLQSQLLHAQKLEAIGQLAGGIAHDFNNILTGIIGYGNLLQMSLSAGTPPRVYADSILSSGEKAAKLTHSLLAFSRKQGIQQSPLSLHEILRSLEPLLRRLVTEDIDFHVVYSSIDPTIFADSVQIDQVIINLVTNARDAMAGGGLLTVRTGTGEVSREKAQELGLKEPGSYAILSIEDSGVGISEEVKARLFDPFFTTKEVGQGTGLGLSIVYGIVGQHGGAIAVQSRLGKGSRFDVYLPIHQALVAPKNHRPLQPIGGNETILLAEDDDSVRKMVSTVLTVSGYTVIEAEDGEVALSQFLKHQDEIDLVILDVVMPKKNGREVCEWIRERKPAVKFLFTSGYTKNIIDGKGFSEEGADFIAKPAHPSDLLAKIRHVLGSTP